MTKTFAAWADSQSGASRRAASALAASPQFRDRMVLDGDEHPRQKLWWTIDANELDGSIGALEVSAAMHIKPEAALFDVTMTDLGILGDGATHRLVFQAFVDPSDFKPAEADDSFFGRAGD